MQSRYKKKFPKSPRLSLNDLKKLKPNLINEEKEIRIPEISEVEEALELKEILEVEEICLDPSLTQSHDVSKLLEISKKLLNK